MMIIMWVSMPAEKQVSTLSRLPAGCTWECLPADDGGSREDTDPAKNGFKCDTNRSSSSLWPRANRVWKIGVKGITTNNGQKKKHCQFLSSSFSAGQILF